MFSPQIMQYTVPHAPKRKFKLKEMGPFAAHLVSEVSTVPKSASFDVLQPHVYSNTGLSSMSGTDSYILLG
jgi:hypothetical protein